MALYGLIDCAQDASLFPAVRREAEQRSLFGGVIAPELIGATPHIVRLDEGSALRAALQGEGWARNWGIVCTSDAAMLDVRRQLRKNLQVMLPDGRPALFRFYDPRVWVTYIENCPPAALPRWFGAITAWWAPFQGGSLRYQAGAGGLQRQLVTQAATAAR